MGTIWQFWIDVGGTFTDCVGRAPDGTTRRHKVLSSGVTKGRTSAASDAWHLVDTARCRDPMDFWRGYKVQLLDAKGRLFDECRVVAFDREDGRLRLDRPLGAPPGAGQSYELFSEDDAPLLAIRWLLGLPLDAALPPLDVRLGTTRGTNALLTRRGARTALVTTRGFADVLRIGYQNRPRLFDLDIRKPEPLFSRVVEIDERVTADGQVLAAPRPDVVRRQLSQLLAEGVESLAICLLNSYCQPMHESLVADLARDVGFGEVSVSHQVAPLIKIVARGDTTVVDAYLTPVLRSYLARLESALGHSNGGDVPPSTLRLLTSAGGLVSARQFRGKDSVLSGPAGGVVGFSRVAQAAGFDRGLGFDMGGTSTDVSRFDGRFELEYETEKAGVRIVAPMLSIETVAAGGGSLCWFDGVKLAVGPDSAGADPGPACYGRGGPLAVTDINLWLGRLLPKHFPFPLDRDAVERRLRETCDTIRQATGQAYSLDELADGFVRIANANMAQAIRSISIGKGYDPRDYVLVAFGGAAPQHACAVADELEIPRILIHPDASVLSAYGIGLADVVRHRVAGVYRAYDAALLSELDATFSQLAHDATREVLAEAAAADQLAVVRSLDLRYRGLDAALTVACPPDGDYATRFVAEHRRRYGYVHANRAIEVVAARVEVVGRATTALPRSRPAAAQVPPVGGETTTWFHGLAYRTQVLLRDHLAPGAAVLGPAMIVEPHSVVVVEPGWRAEMWTEGVLVLTRDHAGHLTARRRAAGHDEPDPTLLEIFNNQFAGIAQQMGITLRNTSSSVNVKERLDFSCALFTASGDLVVNAPHIPVHLGAMGETVRAIVAANPVIHPGDVFVTNDPYGGGSHLPDITVVTPVHDAATGQLRFFTASRAHHAEIGGITPGSMPPFSRNLAEEGVLIRNFLLVDAGESRFDALRDLLTSGPYPTRSVDDNLADLAAQVAANHQGQRDLERLIEKFGWPVVDAYMRHIQAAAERKMRAALARLPAGRREFVDHLDDGSPIQVAVTIEGDSATIDFTGTGGVLAGNLNANRAITSAAVLYVLRCLIGEEIPLNQGVLEPIRLILPECLLNPSPGDSPATSPAVVGGNVETSQRVVDVLLGAFGLAAASQGTMNNLLFGDATFGYYETICGGAGATPQADGADAVHTHMTNTRLTDPEVMEKRFPVRVREFSIRRGSGGAGLHHGGDGVTRRIEFLRELDVSLLQQRRGPYPPFGLKGGGAGALGRNTLRRVQGDEESLPGTTQLRVHPGDVLTIETPGGGGWGGSKGP